MPRSCPLFKDLFIETNPVPVKAALGDARPNIEGNIACPLVPISPKSWQALEATLKACGCLQMKPHDEHHHYRFQRPDGPDAGRLRPGIRTSKSSDEFNRGTTSAQVIAGCDVVIDFSAHSATLASPQLCANHSKALVIGTTGHSNPRPNALTSKPGEFPWSGPRTFPRASTPCSG